MNGTNKRLKCTAYCLFVFLLSASLFLPEVQARSTATATPRQPTDSVRTVFSEVIYFRPGNCEWIEEQEYPKTGRLLRWALSDTVTPIVITGWADATGTPELNARVSLRRALTVRNYLVSKGIAARRIRTEGRGVDTQAASNDEARRAEVRVLVRSAVESVPTRTDAGTGQTTPVITEEKPVREKGGMEKDTLSSGQNAVRTVTPVQQQTEPEPQQPQQPLPPQQSVKAVPENLSPSLRYVAVKTNLAAWAGTIMNLAADVQVSEHFSVELPVLWCPWYVSDKHAIKTFTIQPEGRYWLTRPGEGHFFGVHAHVGWFNVKWNRDRYQDTDRPLLGAGISYGYLLPLGEHWAGEFTLGAGYANLKYNTYYNIGNGARIDTRTKNYWGITRVGISVVYRFNLK